MIACRRVVLWSAVICLICAAQICVAQSCPQDQPKGVNPAVPAPQNAKVCRYDRAHSAAQPSYWWQLLYELFKWKPTSQPPFRRSVAFLAGVSHYSQMSPQLDFVNTDLTELRNFLLTDGGFDTVYEVRDRNVNHQVMEEFMGKYFTDPKGILGAEDRLLFYYSGHGGAQSEIEPYLLFQNANPPNDYSDGLPVRDVYRWARTIPAKHLLIILDSCFSGLAPDKAGPEDMTASLSNALAGEPSGLLLTAGTGDEKAYAVQYSKQRNGSIFTHALIDALKNMSRTEGIVTIGEAFERAKVTVAVFDAVENKKMTPLRTPLARHDGLGKGNFIFINPKADNPTPPAGVQGGGSAIAKAPANADPNLTLMQKEYDEVKNSTDLEALRAFDSSYKGKAFGQTLVYLIEEKITRIEHRVQVQPSVQPPMSKTSPANTRPKDLRSDFLYLAKLARGRRLRELRGRAADSDADTNAFVSTFVATGADECEVDTYKSDHKTQASCTFPTDRFSLETLLSAVKSAVPNLEWTQGKQEGQNLTIYGEDASLLIEVSRDQTGKLSVCILEWPPK